MRHAEVRTGVGRTGWCEHVNERGETSVPGSRHGITPSSHDHTLENRLHLSCL